MKNVFRILETETHEILLSKDFNDEENNGEYQIIMSFFIEDGFRANMTFGYKDEKIRDKMFLKITKEEAEQTVINTIKNLS